MEIGRTEIFLDKDLFKVVVKEQGHLKGFKSYKPMGKFIRLWKLKGNRWNEFLILPEVVEKRFERTTRLNNLTY